MRGIDSANPENTPLNKDVAYVGGYLDDVALRKAGYGFINELGVIPNGGLQLVAKLGLSEKDLSYPFLNLATEYCMTVMLPQLESASQAAHSPS